MHIIINEDPTIKEENSPKILFLGMFFPINSLMNMGIAKKMPSGLVNPAKNPTIPELKTLVFSRK